jgi:hypothetical protein
MRYVIIFASIMFFYIWDGMFNGGRYLDHTLRAMVGVVRTVTGWF